MTVWGIDVSKYQGTADVIRSTGAQFVMIRATLGDFYVDPDLDRNVQDAVNARIPFGLYHYAKGNGVKFEAEWFLSHVGKWRGVAVLALDFEYAGVLAAPNDGESWALYFLDYVNARWPGKPLIYGSRSWTEKYTNIAKNGYRLWSAFPGQTAPTAVGAFSAEMVPMIQYETFEDIDRDVFFGTTADFQAMARDNIKETPTPAPTTKDDEVSYILAQDIATHSEGTIYRIMVDNTGSVFKVAVSGAERKIMDAWPGNAHDPRFTVAQVPADVLDGIPTR